MKEGARKLWLLRSYLWIHLYVSCQHGIYDLFEEGPVRTNPFLESPIHCLSMFWFDVFCYFIFIHFSKVSLHFWNSRFVKKNTFFKHLHRTSMFKIWINLKKIYTFYTIFRINVIVYKMKAVFFCNTISIWVVLSVR